MIHASWVWVAWVAWAMPGSATFSDDIAATTAASATHTTAVTAPGRAATVVGIAERPDVGVQTRCATWGNMRTLPRAGMESSVTGAADLPRVAGRPPAVFVASLDPGDSGDPRQLLAHLSHQYRLLAERAAVGWQTYRDGAGVDPDIAADWRQLNELRRPAFQALFPRGPARALRPGLGPAAAAHTAWVIPSPDTH